MWKVVFFLRYRDDVDRAEAERRFAGSHAEIVLETPGLLRYVQNSVLDTGGPGQSAGGRPLADAYAAMWFADRDAYLAATQTVLQKHGGLWFNDEAFVVARRRA